MHVSIAVTSLFVVTAMQHHRPISVMMIGFVFLGSFSGYNIIKGYTHIEHPNTSSKWIRALTIIGMLCAAILFCFFSKEFKWIVSITTLLCLLYIKPFYKAKSLRYFPIVKIIAVATAWSCITYLLVFTCCSPTEVTIGLFENNWTNDIKSQVNPIAFLQRLVLITALCIPFEIKDLTHDDPKLATLPQLVGITVSKLIGLILLIGYGIGIALQFQATQQQYVEIAIMIVTGLGILFTRKEQSVYYTRFFIEAIPILWLIALMIMNYASIHHLFVSV